ncbi:zinc finger protein 429-like [Ixodes scapularis]
MEPTQSSSEGDALLGEISYPLKATEDVWFGCCSCTYVIRDHRGIVSHLVVHADEQFKFEHLFMLSGSRFKVPSSTQKHKSDKSFKCKLFPLAFAQNSTLTNHNLTHAGEKPYKCKLCPKAFAENHLLTRHSLVHTGEKTFKCKLCPQAFAFNSNLRRHNITHTGEKQFKSKLCPLTFADNSSLRSLFHHV